MAIALEFGAQSDTGCVRENNEDSYRAIPELRLFVLSDGMGGLAFGEVASRLAVDALVEHCREAESNPSLHLMGDPIEGISSASNRLASGIRRANEIVHRTAQEKGAAQQMGATIVAVRFDGERMSLAHVGDSRAYRLRSGEFQQLTQDHSFVAEEVRQGRMTSQEAGSSTLQNVLVRALGVEPEVEVDVSDEPVAQGDIVLLCSDGLTRELTDAQIAAVLADGDPPKQTARQLVDLAKLAGGGDNITAIVVRAGKSSGTFSRFSRVGKWFKSSGNSF